MKDIFQYFEPPKNELTVGKLMAACSNKFFQELISLWNGPDEVNGRHSYIDVESDWFTALAEVFNEQ